MKEFKTEKYVEEKERKVLVRVTCDFCGRHIANKGRLTLMSFSRSHSDMEWQNNMIFDVCKTCEDKMKNGKLGTITHAGCWDDAWEG